MLGSFQASALTPQMQSGGGFRYYQLTISSNYGNSLVDCSLIILKDSSGADFVSNIATVVDESASTAGYEADGALTGAVTVGTRWLTPDTELPNVFIVFDVGSPKEAASLEIEVYQPNRGPKDFVLSGSNDLTSWTELLATQGLETGDRQIFSIG